MAESKWEKSSGYLNADQARELLQRARTLHLDGSQSLEANVDDEAIQREREQAYQELVSKGRPLQSWSQASPLNAVAFSPDGYLFASGGGYCTGAGLRRRCEGELRLFDITKAEEKILQHIVPHDYEIQSLTFSPNGRFVLTRSGDSHRNIGEVRLFEVETGHEFHRWSHDSFVLSASFSPDTRLVLTGSWNSLARLLDTETGEERQNWQSEDESVSVRGVAGISPNGRWVLTGGDRYASLYDLESSEHRQLQRIHWRDNWDHEGEVNLVAFSPDNRRVLTGVGEYRVCLRLIVVVS